MQSENEKLAEDKSPIFSSWKKLYSIVLINLVVLIILFYIFTKVFS